MLNLVCLCESSIELVESNYYLVSQNLHNALNTIKYFEK